MVICTKRLVTSLESCYVTIWALPGAPSWYRTSKEFIFVLVVAHLAHLGTCSNYVEDATSF